LAVFSSVSIYTKSKIISISKRTGATTAVYCTIFRRPRRYIRRVMCIEPNIFGRLSHWCIYNIHYTPVAHCKAHILLPVHDNAYILIIILSWYIYVCIIIFYKILLLFLARIWAQPCTHIIIYNIIKITHDVFFERASHPPTTCVCRPIAPSANRSKFNVHPISCTFLF